MQKFIKKIFKNFHESDLNKNDLDSIDLMQDYIYNRMNEIYPTDTLYSNSKSEVISSLVKTLNDWENDIQKEYLKLDNELYKKEKSFHKNIKHMHQIDLFTFFYL